LTVSLRHVSYLAFESRVRVTSLWPMHKPRTFTSHSERFGSPSRKEFLIMSSLTHLRGLSSLHRILLSMNTRERADSFDSTHLLKSTCAEAKES